MWGSLLSLGASALTGLFATRIGATVVTAGAGYVAGRTSQRSKLEEWVGFSLTPLNISMLVGGLLAVMLFYKWATGLVTRKR